MIPQGPSSRQLHARKGEHQNNKAHQRVPDWGVEDEEEYIEGF